MYTNLKTKKCSRSDPKLRFFQKQFSFELIPTVELKIFFLGYSKKRKHSAYFKTKLGQIQKLNKLHIMTILKVEMVLKRSNDRDFYKNSLILFNGHKYLPTDFRNGSYRFKASIYFHFFCSFYGVEWGSKIYL